MHRIAMRALAWLALMVVIAWSAPALGAASHVAIVKPDKRDAGIDEASVRLGAELGAAGFVVVVLTAKRGVDARSQVESIVLDPPPFAIIAIMRTPEGAAADVWVADRLSNKTVVRRIAPGDLEAEAPPRALAIRAVELLRASLLEVEADPESKLPEDVARWMREQQQQLPEPAPVAPLPPPAWPAPAAPPPAPYYAPPPDRFVAPREEEHHTLFETATVGIAPGLLVGALVDVAFVPTLRASAPLPFQLCARLTLSGTILDNTLEAPAGKARVSQHLALVELGRSFLDADDRLVPMLSLGVGAYRFGANGDAVGGFRSLSAESWSFAISGGGGLALRVVDSLAFTLEAHVLVVLPRANVQIGPDVLGPHGLPLFHPTLGLLVSL